MNALTAKVSLEALQKHLSRISKPRDPFENPDTLQDIQHYIEDEFRSYGYKVTNQTFSFQGNPFQNVIAGKEKPGKKFIIGAHFDGVPGTDAADDNASGVAALLEAARVLSDSPIADQIEWLGFNLEEYSMVGSSHYVQTLDAKNILGMFSLEMIGYTDKREGSQEIPLPLRPFYPNTGDFLALVGDGNSKKLLKQSGNAFKNVEGLKVETLTVPLKGNILPEVRLSDHSPFWDAGIPALLVTDTSFFRNPHYHKPSDTIETLDLEFLLNVTKGVVRFVSELGTGT